MTERVLLISPVRNEAGHIEAVVNAMSAQTHPPAAWIVVDDHSDDGTPELLRRLEQQVPFMTVVEAPAARSLEEASDRLAQAAELRAFNIGLGHAPDGEYTHIGKLDGDIELPPDYFERLLARFAADSQLGIAGGVLQERIGTDLRRIRIPDHHVHGAVKLYRRDCFDAIGGLQERLAWDTIDGVYARMRGFNTRSFADIVAHHHREWGSTGGKLRGRARHGECAYISAYTPSWVLLRSLKLATVPPFGLSGGAFLYGYVRAWVRRAPRVEDREFRRFVRRELRSRLLRPMRPRHAR